ncbi:hypothetical protein CKAN_01378700 [Cinnamomum micranthum f. kanehirae]|uniref:Uncharacterized protein n=1 Tax=Cinnamomum micranthum f. kanehirae TaxID=337451 RepID=A0A3S3QIK0_9MAGN|nr:hypothetical protein CKAN_01378700 [Cinnamomum micranthum f. kanehirae]
MRKVPVKFSDYSHSMVDLGYVLNDQEQFFLRGFKEYYESKEVELASICTMISSNDLKKALNEGTWLDTNLMYYYFEIMREGCPTAFIADPSICSWWQDGSNASVEAAFGKHGHRVWEAREAHTLVFVVHYRNHFTLVVGYVDEKRWEFYNSLAGDRLTQNKAEKFVSMVWDPKLQFQYIV